jgi:hypothetical protein
LFERPHHQKIGLLLAGLNAEALRSQGCYFGGGTAISLAFGEYRESVDVDFICSSVDGYRAIRNQVNRRGLDWAFAEPPTLARELRVDQYAIRAAILIEGRPIKLEIVFEGRVALEVPMEGERICGVWTLHPWDRVATKLMANADRWADDAVMSRDLIDLAMLSEDGHLAHEGVAKAERAYGDAILDALKKSKAHLLERPGRLKRCMDMLGMAGPEGRIRRRVERLRPEPKPQGSEAHLAE